MIENNKSIEDTNNLEKVVSKRKKSIMPIEVNFSQSDRDRIMKTEIEVDHIQSKMNGVESELEKVVEATRNNAYSVAGLLESMKDIKAFMQESSKDRSRLETVERDVSTMKDQIKPVDELEKKIDRAVFLGKVAYSILTTPVAIYVLIAILDFFKKANG